MKNIPLLLGTIIGTLVLIFAIAFFFSGQSIPQDLIADPVQVKGEGRPAKGNPDARVTIVEFSDFECPACKATAPLVEKAFKQYEDSVQLVYRHFPLDSIHFNARTAAQAAEVAYTEGKFWEMHDFLFDTQQEWSNITDDSELIELFAVQAEELGIDKAVFLEKMESDAIKDAVSADAAQATTLGLRATPTFFVNGVQTPAQELVQAIEAELAKEQ